MAEQRRVLFERRHPEIAVGLPWRAHQ
jgi:hypothetical protein